MSRYQLPNPLCRHKPKGFVSAGKREDGPFASTMVCDREACVQDAQEWAAAKTLQVPTPFTPFMTTPGWAKQVRDAIETVIEEKP